MTTLRRLWRRLFHRTVEPQSCRIGTSESQAGKEQRVFQFGDDWAAVEPYFRHLMMDAPEPDRERLMEHVRAAYEKRS